MINRHQHVRTFLCFRKSEMAVIQLETTISAPINRVYDLCLSVDAHLSTTHQTHERVAAGRQSGLLQLGERITWEAKHLGIKQRLEVEITQMVKPHFFVDEQVRGPFASLIHRHQFTETNSGTRMQDHFTFRAPFGILGSLVDKLYLTEYLRRFLILRNQELKTIAESEAWRSFL